MTAKFTPILSIYVLPDGNFKERQAMRTELPDRDRLWSKNLAHIERDHITLVLTYDGVGVFRITENNTNGRSLRSVNIIAQY